MNKNFGIAFAAALLVILGLVWAGLEKTRGNHLVPTGSIGKVRVEKVADDTTLVVFDFKLRNDSDRDLVVRRAQGLIRNADGTTETGISAAVADIQAAFQAYPDLGEQFNPVLKERDVIKPHQEVDRMLAVRFDLTPEAVEHRKSSAVRIEDITGPVLQMTGK